MTHHFCSSSRELPWNYSGVKGRGRDFNVSLSGWTNWKAEIVELWGLLIIQRFLFPG